MVYNSCTAGFSELTVSPEEATYDDSDVVLTVTGGTVDSIKLDGSAIASTNYTVSGSTVTIKDDYLETLDGGTYLFELVSGTNNGIVLITIT